MQSLNRFVVGKQALNQFLTIQRNKAGKLKAFAVTSPKRLSNLPEALRGNSLAITTDVGHL